MYNVIFQSDSGKKYVFGANGSTVFDMDLGCGLSVNIGKSQGFSQIGESVETQSVGGKNIKVNGTIYKNVQILKAQMRSVFAPFVSGKLIFENKYYIRVHVKDTPAFSPVKNDGRFTMLLYAPYPFFMAVSEQVTEIGKITPAFSFPINYENPHCFGNRENSKYINVINSGDIEVPFSVRIETNGASTNPVITNMKTLEKLRLNCSLSAGDIVNIYRDSSNVLHAERTSSGATEDVLYLIDESSELFTLVVGDNLISVSDDENGANLIVTLTHNPAMVAVYES